jgi:alkylated DNA nucleotide flippase Atl1
MHTSKGRVRSSVDALYKAIDRQGQLAKVLGLERQARRVSRTLDDFLNEPAEGATESTEGSPGEVETC